MIKTVFIMLSLLLFFSCSILDGEESMLEKKLTEANGPIIIRAKQEGRYGDSRVILICNDSIAINYYGSVFNERNIGDTIKHGK